MLITLCITANAEFLPEVDNDRCVGGLTLACTERAVPGYEAFVRGTILRTNAATAELVKLAENAFRDVNIATPFHGMNAMTKRFSDIVLASLALLLPGR
jgi:UDP-N-acetyl-D-mannosaminuronate dehydrogenase